MLSEEDRATATGNMYGKFGEIWTVVFEICDRTDRQTNRQADSNISHSYRRQSRNQHKSQQTVLNRINILPCKRSPLWIVGI